MSGTVWGTFSGRTTDQARPRVNWSIVDNTLGSTPTSTVRVTLIYENYGPYYAYNSSNTTTLGANGNNSSTTCSWDLRNPPVNDTVWSRDIVVNRDADGSPQNIAIYAYADTSTSFGIMSVSGTVTLPQIYDTPDGSTSSASSVTATSATLNCNVTDLGLPRTDYVKFYTDSGTGGAVSTYVGRVTTGGSTGTKSLTISSLTPNTTYTYSAFADGGLAFAFGEVEFTTSGTAPTVTTQACSSLDIDEVTGNGNVTATGGLTVTRRGFCYLEGSTGTPTTSNSTAYDDGSFGTGAFSKAITGLTPDTDYRVRAYAVNALGTSYGTTVSVTTLISAPTVTIDAGATSITTSAATLSGDVTSDGGATITERGFCYNATGNPTTASSTATVTGTTGSMGTTLTSLAPGVTYYVKGYAINSEGTAYSSQTSFTTLPGDPTSLTATKSDKTDMLLSWTKGSGGNYTIIRRSTGSPPANINSGDLVYQGTGHSTSDSGLTAGTLYYYRAWSATTSDWSEAYSDSYSADSATTVADFTNPANAQTDDTNYATIATSDGKLSCQVSFDGGTTWSNKETLTFNASVAEQSFGDGTSELWGASPTGADITDANLRVKFFDDTGELSYQTYKTFGFAITSTYLLTGLEVKVKAAYDGTDLLLYYVKADPYYGTSSLPIGEGSLAYDSTETLPCFYTGTEWKTLATQDTVEATLESVYPVGSIYINASDDTNPGTLLGFGTWSAFGAGRVPVGIDTGDADFDTAEETGGAKTVTLSTGQMPEHTHTQNSHNHSQNSHDHGMASHNHSQYSHGHQFRYTTNMGSGGYHGPNSTGSLKAANTWVINSTASNYSTTSNSYALTATNNATTATNQTAGNDEAHSNVQPYIVVYMWKRES